MPTIQDLKTNHNTHIRAQTANGSVTRANVAGDLDALADEILARGIAFPADTTALSAISGSNFKFAAVPGNGIFEWLSSGTANGTTIFAASGGGVWSLKISIVSLSALGSIALMNTIDYNSGTITNKPDLSTKQNTLVSGTNIKTINSQSLLGSGNLNIVTSDEIEEYANLAAFPVTGDTDTYYVALDTSILYRWSGSTYVAMSSSGSPETTVDGIPIYWGTVNAVANNTRLNAVVDIGQDHNGKSITKVGARVISGTGTCTITVYKYNNALTTNQLVGTINSIGTGRVSITSFTNQTLAEGDYLYFVISNQTTTDIKELVLNITYSSSVSELTGIPVYWFTTNAVANSTRLNAIVDIGQENNGKTISKIGARVITGTGTCTITVYKYNSVTTTNQLVGTIASIGTSRVSITSFTNQTLAEGDYLYFVISAQTTTDIKEIILNITTT